MFSSLLVLSLAAVAPLAQATVFMTSPIASTSVAAGQSATISWQDDGKAPTLAAFGSCSIGLYAGNQQQQTLLQLIADGIDVSKTSTQTWTPNASDGPNSDQYFIKFVSKNATDPTNAQIPAEAFSAKFTLTAMTGTFNSTVQAEISGVTSAGAASTPAASGSASVARASVTVGTPASTVKASTAASAAASSSKSNGAGYVSVPHICAVTGIAAITFAFFL